MISPSPNLIYKMHKSFSDSQIIPFRLPPPDLNLYFHFRWRTTAGFVGVLDLILAGVFLVFFVGPLLYRSIIGVCSYKDLFYALCGLGLLGVRIWTSWKLIISCSTDTKLTDALEMAYFWVKVNFCWLPLSITFYVGALLIMEDPHCHHSQEVVNYFILMKFTFSLILQLAFLWIIVVYTNELIHLVEYTGSKEVEQLAEMKRFIRLPENFKREFV